jgi:hypothetical protein
MKEDGIVKVDSEILRIEKRIRGLNRVTSAINDLSIYGIFYGNYPELVRVLEHAKDHVKAELKLSKKRLETISTAKAIDGSEVDNEVIDAYLDKRL